MEPIQVKAKTIPDAWFQLVYNLFEKGYRTDIQSGSFEKEQYRIQYPGASVYIEYPMNEMYGFIPEGSTLPSPTTEEFVQDYFANYLMDPELAENETYKYASRIHENCLPLLKTSKTQFQKVLEMLKATPLTNQAVIEIAKPSDVFDCIGNDGKLDPPCLRLIDFKVIPTIHYVCCDKFVGSLSEPHSETCHSRKGFRHTGILTMSVYFRSWDLWAGFPSNLCGLEMLKQYVAEECGLVNGPMYAYSAGLHIYGYQEEFARIRTLKQIKEG